MAPPAFSTQAIGEVQTPTTLFDPSHVGLSFKVVFAIVFAIGALVGPTSGFVWAIYQRDLTFRDTVKDVVQATKDELTAAVNKLDTRQTVTDTKLGSIESTLKSIDSKMEIQVELRARMNASDERFNRLERLIERTGRTSATAAHLTPNES